MSGAMVANKVIIPTDKALQMNFFFISIPQCYDCEFSRFRRQTCSVRMQCRCTGSTEPLIAELREASKDHYFTSDDFELLVNC